MWISFGSIWNCCHYQHTKKLIVIVQSECLCLALQTYGINYWKSHNDFQKTYLMKNERCDSKLRLWRLCHGKWSNLTLPPFSIVCFNQKKTFPQTILNQNWELLNILKSTKHDSVRSVQINFHSILFRFNGSISALCTFSVFDNWKFQMRARIDN